MKRNVMLMMTAVVVSLMGVSAAGASRQPTPVVHVEMDAEAITVASHDDAFRVDVDEPLLVLVER